MAVRRVLADLARGYAESVVVESVGGVDAEKRVAQRERFDFVVLAADAIERLASGGHLTTHVAIARSAIAVAVPAGAAHPDLSTSEGLRAALASARAVGCSTGPSGRHLARLLERWNIATPVVEAAPGVPVATLLASGQADLGFQQRSELVDCAGIDIVGPLPADVQLVTTFAGAACAASRQVEAARRFLAYCASPAAAGVKLRHGMEA